MAKPHDETTLLDRSSRHTVTTIAETVYEAAINGEGWTGILDDLRRAIDAQAIALIDFQSPAAGGFIRLSVGVSPEFVDLYDTGLAAHDLWLKRLDCSAGPSLAKRGDELVPERLLVGGEFYRDWLAPQDLFHAMLTPLIRRGDSHIVCAVFRSEAGGRFDADAATHFARESDHLSRALQIHDILGRTAAERDAAFAALDQIPVGVIVVDDRGNMLDANHVANEILASNDGLSVNTTGLTALTHEATSSLQEMIAGAFRGDGNREPAEVDTMALERRSGESELAITAGRMALSGRFLGTERRAAILFVTDPETPVDLDASKLRRLYKLTPAESRLATLLARGLRLEDAAGDLEVSLNTVRTHLKRIFSKTGTDRQAELVRLILSGPARITGTSDA